MISFAGNGEEQAAMQGDDAKGRPSGPSQVQNEGLRSHERKRRTIEQTRRQRTKEWHRVAEAERAGIVEARRWRIGFSALKTVSLALAGVFAGLSIASFSAAGPSLPVLGDESLTSVIATVALLLVFALSRFYEGAMEDAAEDSREAMRHEAAMREDLDRIAAILQVSEGGEKDGERSHRPLTTE